MPHLLNLILQEILTIILLSINYSSKLNTPDMRNKKIKLLPLFLLIFCIEIAVAQKTKIAPKSIPLFTADSLVSGNTKDVLTSFFQLAFNNLTGEDKQLNFTSNPFAIMLKSNPGLNIDNYYSKYNALRKLNIGFGIKLDTNYRFNGFSSGVKYALINQRDHTTSRMFATGLKVNGFLDERTALNAALREYAIEKFNQSSKTDADRKVRNAFLKSVSDFFNQKIAFSKLDTDFKKVVLQLIDEQGLENIGALVKNFPDSSLKSNDMKIFDDLKESIKTAALWTIGLSDTTYNKQFAFSNLVLNSEFSKGIFKPRPGANNVELNIKAACNFLKDTMQTGNNLKRTIFNFETGLNWVIRDKSNERSLFEFKLSGSYYHNFSNLYKDEKRDLVTANGTIRVRVYEDIWIPLDFKYNPTNGKIFGLFNIKANFTGLSKLLKG